MSQFKNSYRYMQILQTIKFLKDGGIPTEQWIREQAEIVREYRNDCVDFSELMEDIEEPEFRDSALNVENLINELCVDLFYSRPFDVKKYYEMMVSLELMCRSFITTMEFVEAMEKLGC
jgi:hypothetical protein